jgi:hypothetical protein
VIPTKYMTILVMDSLISQWSMIWDSKNARYLKDWFHLFFTGLTDTFGQYGAELLEDELKQMIRARNQEYFMQAKMNATTKLHQISPRNMLLEKKLEEFANANHEHSQFLIDTMKGSRGLHGSSMSEQNHASILCNLNAGHTKNNTNCEEPMTLFKDLMERNRLHGILMNKMLADADNARGRIDKNLRKIICQKIKFEAWKL